MRFIVVGTSAAAVHWAVVRCAVEWFGLVPLVANVLGWMIAFSVSFSGHRLWTFSDTTSLDTGQSLGRFLIVSLTGFMINEATYAVLLQFGWLPYDLTLAVVLVLVAGGTFVVSRAWAFRSARPAVS